MARIIKKGISPARRAAWWVGQHMQCRKCACVWELERGDKVQGAEGGRAAFFAACPEPFCDGRGTLLEPPPIERESAPWSPRESPPPRLARAARDGAAPVSPVGRLASEAAARRAATDPEYARIKAALDNGAALDERAMAALGPAGDSLYAHPVGSAAWLATGGRKVPGATEPPLPWEGWW